MSEKNNNGNGSTTAAASAPAVPSTAGVSAVIYMLQLLIVIGKYLPAIMTFMAALNGILAAYNFTRGEIGWGIFHSIFAVLTVIFLVQLYQRRNVHSYDYDRQSGRAALRQSSSCYYQGPGTTGGGDAQAS